MKESYIVTRLNLMLDRMDALEQRVARLEVAHVDPVETATIRKRLDTIEGAGDNLVERVVALEVRS